LLKLFGEVLNFKGSTNQKKAARKRVAYSIATAYNKDYGDGEEYNSHGLGFSFLEILKMD